MYAKSAVAAMLLASAATVSAVGSATVMNSCDQSVFIQSTGVGYLKTATLQPGQKYTETYFTPVEGGISIKMGWSEAGLYTNQISQLEYTMAGPDDVWYDASNINGFPFLDQGYTLTPSESGCPTVSCAAGVNPCPEAYTTPDENAATKACSNAASIVMNLCANGSGSSSGSGSSAAAQAPASSSAVAPPASSSAAAAAAVSVAQAVSSASVAPVSTAPAAVAKTQAVEGPQTTFVTKVVTAAAPVTVIATSAAAPSSSVDSLPEEGVPAGWDSNTAAFIGDLPIEWDTHAKAKRSHGRRHAHHQMAHHH